MKNNNSQPIQGPLQEKHPQSQFYDNQLLLNYNQFQFNHSKSLFNHYQFPNNYRQSFPDISLFSLFLLAIPLLFLFLSGCEKVIDVDLNDSEPAIVIEGNLSHKQGLLEVKVSRTSSYFNNEPVKKVENAVVYLENDQGFNLKAAKMEPGVYKLINLPLNVNSLYRLTVVVEEEEFTALSFLPPLIEIDSLGYEYQREQTFFDSGYRILLYFTDPPEVENYYRVKVYRNGERFDDTDDIIVFDDSSLDGKNVQVTLRGQLFEEGDTARVELLSIDKNAWEYFSTLSEVANLNPGSPSPANPSSNLSSGALGYFSAWSVSTSDIVIPE